MGCNQSKPQKSLEIDYSNRIIDYIKRDDCSYLEQLIKLYSSLIKSELSETVNKAFIQVNDRLFNMLAFSVWEGKSNIFSYLLSKVHCSVALMEENFYQYKLNTLTIICEKGHIGILKRYLPIYLEQNNESRLMKVPKISISNDQITEDFQPSSIPIQAACKYGHVNILHYVKNYFSDTSPPSSLDIHAVDNLTGENCALIAVRTGNFVLIKLLNETLGADFHLKNKKLDGALQILAQAAKRNCPLEFLECAMYLIQIIKIDVAYRIEETLKSAQNMTIVKYFREHLKTLGISIEISDPNTYGRSRNTTFKDDISMIRMDSDVSLFTDSGHIQNLCL